MKKEFALIAMVAIGMMAACSKSEVNDRQPQQPVIEDDGSPVAIQFGVGSPNVSVETKSTGVVGDIEGQETNVWNSQPLYIYGLDNTVKDFSTAEPFINNVMALAPKGLVSAEIDVLNESPDPSNPDAAPEPFYYQGNTVYDFYGYHIDDAYKVEGTEEKPEPKREATRIYIPFKITGSQDLMIAKANPEEDMKKSDEIKDVRNVYSAYAARRGVNPTLAFNHVLTRFTFNVVAGAESGDDVYIDKIEVNSKTTGNLVIVSSDETGTPRGIADTKADASMLPLMQKSEDGGDLVSLEKVKPEAFDSESPKSKQVGESLMVIPGEAEYKLVVTMSDATGEVSTPIPPLETVIKATSVKGGNDSPTFEAGKSYNVTIKIYGPQKIEITATLTGWEDGGNVEIDPDEPPFQEEATEEPVE